MSRATATRLTTIERGCSASLPTSAVRRAAPRHLQIRGVKRAADIVEQAILSRRPVTWSRSFMALISVPLAARWAVQIVPVPNRHGLRAIQGV